MNDQASVLLPPRTVRLANGWMAERVRTNIKAPRYKAGEYRLFDEQGYEVGRASARSIERIACSGGLAHG